LLLIEILDAIKEPEMYRKRSGLPPSGRFSQGCGLNDIKCTYTIKNANA